MGAISPEEVTRLWDRYGPPLVLYARQWTTAPDDVVQEAFLLLVRQTERPDSAAAWLYRVVRNRAINAARSGARAARRESATAAGRELWFEPSPGDRLDAAAATEALAELPAAEREAIVARLWGGLSYEEIARLSGRSTSGVYRDYQRGLASLRERLGESCPRAKTDAGR